MSNQLNKVFGIDLGTTYSCISYVNEHGKAEVLQNSDSQRITPSVVFFDDDQIIVGDEAKNNLKIYPKQVVSFIKRDMGDPHYIFEYQGVTYKPEEISSYILKKLVEDARQMLGEEIKDVVITCPAYFGINEREATKLAGEIAGLNVKAIINEPTAAAIAYGMDSEENKVVLVYDLGGGTFDITMIEIKPESIEVIVTGGNHSLGGKDWDNKLITYLAQRFADETGGDANALMDDSETLGELMIAAEQAKKSLSTREKTRVSVVHSGDKVAIEITRDEFDSLTEDLLERTLSLTREMLESAKEKGYHTYDEILLVGGSSKMPQVMQAVKRNFDADPKLYDPDESVAKGAAIYGWKTAIDDELKRKVENLIGGKADDVVIEELDASTLAEIEQELADEMGLTLGAVQKSRTEIKNVSSKSFGVIAKRPQDGVDILANLILRNTSIPAEVSQSFGTFEDQQLSVEIKIMENDVSERELEPSNGKEIGIATLDLPAGLPKGSPIEITFHLNNEGRLDIRAVEVTDQRVVEVSIETSSVISGEELAEAKARSQSITIS